MTTAIELASKAFNRAADALPGIMDLADAEVALLADLTLVYGQEVDPDDAEAVEQRLEAMSRLAAEFVGNEALVVRKVERYIHVLEAQDSLIEGFKRRAKRLRDRATAVENGQEKLKQHLIAAMHTMGREQIITPSGPASIVQNPLAVTVVDAAAVPHEYERTKIEITVDRRAIIADFKKSGEIPPGVTITRGERLDWR